MGGFNLNGQRFDMLLVIRRAENRKKLRVWECLCDCGKIVYFTSTALLKSKKIKTSCGCAHIESLRKRKTTHGKSYSPEYKSWRAMKARCENKKSTGYENYGGRGITVCDRWANSFHDFYSDMGDRPNKSYTIDRFPNPNGNYEPSNCRWATKQQQNNGRRCTKWFEYAGVKKTQSEWAKYFGLSHVSVLISYAKRNSFEKAYIHYMARRNA